MSRADADYLLLSADYSQIELRIIAALSREPGLLEAFKTGADVHTATAARVFGVFPEMVTPEMRRKAKMVNYGIAYGISAFGLAQRLGIPRKEAAEIIEPVLQAIRRHSQLHGRDDRLCARTWLRGDRHRPPALHPRHPLLATTTVRGAAERNAINAPIQGTAADMIKIAMVRFTARIRPRKLQDPHAAPGPRRTRL